MGFVSQDSALFTTSTFGRSGVQVFFVISGFVIPYALHASGYTIRNYGRFLLKRLVRLDPPYIAAILLSVVIAGYHTLINGDVFPYSLPQLLTHLGYVNAFFRHEWVNWVFWTLAIEVQYYIVIGLVFPLLMYPKLFWTLAAPALLMGAARHPDVQSRLLLPWMPFFMLGIAAFHYRRRMIHWTLFVYAMLLPTLYALLFAGTIPAVASVVTAIIVGTVSFSVPRPFIWLGTISYSLYLIHGPVGGNFGHSVLKVAPGLPPLVIVFVSLAACIAAAWGLYRLVELPSQRLSKKIRYAGTGRVLRKEIGASSGAPAAVISG